MAVVQISRIQIRRGQKNQGSGIPQLASGEMGWAIDSRELYIGNGSVAEGAPAVGNTKVITEHDNLFTLANTYTYLNNITVQTGESATSPIKRTLQARLDELVTIRSFGGTGDGTDHTLILQRAINQLYINSSTKGTPESRVTLRLPAGTYALTGTIYVPPYTTIVGDGIDKTKITISDNVPIFQTVNGSSTPNNYADDSSSTLQNQATNVKISGMTLTTSSSTSPVIVLQSCKESELSDLKIAGTWTTGNTIVDNNAGISLGSLSTLVASHQNNFKNIKFENLSVGVKSDDDVYNNHWDTCYFHNLGNGVVFGKNTVIGTQGQSVGPNKNKIQSCDFSNIDREAFIVNKGSKNFSIANNYSSIGNVGGDESNAQYAVIDFTDSGNNSENDLFSRTEDLGYNQTFITQSPYISEIKGKVNSKLGGFHVLEVSEASSYTYFFRLPGDYSRTYEIEYSYSSGIVNAQRSGKMTFMLDTTTNSLDFVDDFQYQGDSAYENNLQFLAQMVNTDGNLGVDTIIVSMLNYTTNDQGTFNYNIKVIG